MMDATTINTNPNRRLIARHDYRDAIAASIKVNWRLEDIIGGNDKRLNFSRRFMPEPLARVEALEFLNEDEKRILNQIRGHAYLSIFGIVEEFIVPFVMDHIRPSLDEDDYRVRAYLQFAVEEVKHIQLFKLFCEEFRENFGTECGVIGPASEIRKAILSRSPLSVALAILMIEWMTQGHFIDSVKSDLKIDQQFRTLLKYHWLEEAQHAKLDALMVEVLAEGMNEEELSAAIDGFLEIGAFLDDGLKQQVLLDLDSFERATGRVLTDGERQKFIEVQLRANRWTYLGSGLVHPRFLETLDLFGPAQKERIAAITPAFC